MAGKRRFNGLDLAHALDLGAKQAYRAVPKPVEGTILTVIREAAAAAVVAAERDNNVETVLAATVDAAERAVAKTPSLLPILREAHVVDSGGQGLYRLFQGALDAARGLGAAMAGRGGQGPRPGRTSMRPPARSRRRSYGYETVYLLRVAARPAARHRRDPGPPRGDRRLGAGRRRRADGQDPRPQRAARRGDRLRPLDRDAVADHHREPRRPGARRAGGEGGGVRRRGRWSGRRGPRHRRDRRPGSGSRRGRGRGPGRGRAGPGVDDAPGRRGRGPVRGPGGHPRRHRGAVPRVRRVPDRPRRPVGQPVHGRAARGGRGDPGRRAADPAQQPQRDARGAPGRLDDRPARSTSSPLATSRRASRRCSSSTRGSRSPTSRPR